MKTQLGMANVPTGGANRVELLVFHLQNVFENLKTHNGEKLNKHNQSKTTSRHSPERFTAGELLVFNLHYSLLGPI